MELTTRQEKVPVTAYREVTKYTLEVTEDELIYLLHLGNRHGTVSNVINEYGPLNTCLRRFLIGAWNDIRKKAPKVFEKFLRERDRLRLESEYKPTVESAERFYKAPSGFYNGKPKDPDFCYHTDGCSHAEVGPTYIGRPKC